MSSENQGGLYTSQAADRYLRFPATVSACAGWLPCQAEAVHAKTVCSGDLLNHVFNLVLQDTHMYYFCPILSQHPLTAALKNTLIQQMAF